MISSSCEKKLKKMFFATRRGGATSVITFSGIDATPTQQIELINNTETRRQ